MKKQILFSVSVIVAVSATLLPKSASAKPTIFANKCTLRLASETKLDRDARRDLWALRATPALFESLKVDVTSQDAGLPKTILQFDGRYTRGYCETYAEVDGAWKKIAIYDGEYLADVCQEDAETTIRIRRAPSRFDKAIGVLDSAGNKFADSAEGALVRYMPSGYKSGTIAVTELIPEPFWEEIASKMFARDNATWRTSRGLPAMGRDEYIRSYKSRSAGVFMDPYETPEYWMITALYSCTTLSKEDTILLMGAEQAVGARAASDK